jgi:hypothetical protein
MSVSIEGTLQAGLGAAQANLEVQLPLVAAEFPEVAGCHPGTINVLLAVPLLVVSPDHRTRALRWNDDEPQGEVVDLLRISLELPSGSQAVPAWLYIPHHSPHRQDLRLHEVIARRVSYTPGQTCRILIHHSVIQLPYPQWPVVTVL